MKKASKGRLIKLVSMLLALIVAVGMIPVSAGTAAAEGEPSADSKRDLTVELYGINSDDTLYDYDADWAKNGVRAEISGDLSQEPVAVSYSKSNQEEWSTDNLSFTVTSIEAQVPVEPETEEQSKSVNDDNGEPFSEPADEEPSDAEQRYETVVTGYHLTATIVLDASDTTYDGGYDFRYTFGDGSKHTYYSFFAVKLDGMLDKFDADIKQSAGKWHAKADFEGVAEDSGAGIDSITVTYGDEVEPITLGENGKFSFSLNKDYKGDVRFDATDKAGNTKYVTITDVQIDATAPEVTNIEVTPDGWATDFAKVTVEVSDALSGPDNVYYIIEKEGEALSEENAKPAEKKDDGVFTFNLTTDDLQGNIGSAVVFAKDKADNSSLSDTNKQSVAVKIDTEECVITELSVTPGTWTCGEAEVKGTITDNASGVDKDSVNYRLYTSEKKKGDSISVEDVTLDENGAAHFSIKLNSDGKMPTGIYYVDIAAKDIAGNGSKLDEQLALASHPVTVKIQTTPASFKGYPEITNDPVVEDLAYTGGKAIISGIVEDEFSGFESGGVFLKKKRDEDKEENWKKADLENLGSGKYRYSFEVTENFTGRYQIKAVNAAGVVTGNLYTPDKVFVDKLAPSFKKDSITYTAKWASSALIAGTVIDEGGSGVKKISYCLKDRDDIWIDVPVRQDDSNPEVPFTIDIKNTDYEGKIALKTTDNVNNISDEFVFSEKLMLDTQPPVVENPVTSYNGNWTNSDITITVTAHDRREGSTVRSGVERVFGELVSEGGDSVTGEVDAVRSEDDGDSYTITLKASDFADDKSGNALKQGGFKGSVCIKAVDRAKNVSPESVTVNLSVDTEKGIVSIIRYDDNWTNRDLTASLRFMDANSGKPISSGFGKLYCVDKDGNPVEMTCEPDEIESDSFKITIPKTDYNGVYRFFADDKATNRSDDNASSIKAKQDVQAPDIVSLKASEENKWTRQTVTVSGTVRDISAQPLDYNAGVESVWYRKASQQPEPEWNQATNFTGFPDKKEATFSFELPRETFDGKYEVKCVDFAGNESEVMLTETLKYDCDIPVITELTPSIDTWTSQAVVVTGTVSEYGSGIDTIYYEQKIGDVLKTGSVEKKDIVYDPEKGTYSFTKKIPAQSFSGNFDFYCKDTAGNLSEVKRIALKIDNTPPVIESDHSESLISRIIDNITFRFFNYEADNKNNNNLTYKLNLKDDLSGLNLRTLTMSYIDRNGNEKNNINIWENTDELLADVRISRSEDDESPFEEGENPREAFVTFTVKDNFAHSIRFTVEDCATAPNQGVETGKDMMVVDNIAPGRTVTYPAPVNKAFADAEKEIEEYNDGTVEVQDTLYYDTETVDLKFVVTESNFYPEDINGKPEKSTEPEKSAESKEPEDTELDPEQQLFDNCRFTVSKDGAEAQPVENISWINDDPEKPDEYTAILTLGGREDGDGTYVVRMDYTDRSLNKMESFTSSKIVIDTVAPVMRVEYPQCIRSVDDRMYYDMSQDVQVIVTERNFDEACANLSVKAWTYALKSDNTTVIANAPENSYTIDEWTRPDPEKDDYVTTIHFTGNANYDVRPEYTDFCFKKASDRKNIAVDRNEPPVLVKADVKNDVLKKFLGAVTFGYYKDNVELKLLFFDAVSGMYTFSGKGEKTQDSADINEPFTVDERFVNSEAGLTDISLSIPSDATDENFDGIFYATAADRAGNSVTLNPFTWQADENTKTPYGFIIDNKEPEASVSVNSPSHIRNGVAYYNKDIIGTIRINETNFDENYFDNDLKLMITESDLSNSTYRYGLNSGWDSEGDLRTHDFVISDNGTYFYRFNYTDPSRNVSDELTAGNMVIDKLPPVGKGELSPSKRTVDGHKYYDADATLTLTINEHNFDPDDVFFVVDGVQTSVVWTSEGDTHKAKYVFTDNGTHSYSLNYTDLATNRMDQVADGDIVIDLIDPKLYIDYSFGSDEGTVYDGRRYLDRTCTAVVTVVEDNFSAEDTVITITGRDSAGSATELKDSLFTGDWKHSGNVHKRSISFSRDFNYTVEAKCHDLAWRSINPYTPDLFTVDTVDPGEIWFSFSEPVSSAPYRFYNNQVRVDISCYDETSGVRRFDYEGILAEGVSSINRAVVKTAVEDASISQNGNTYTATFYIPKEQLGSDNSFNGNVTAGAYDRSGNFNETADTTRLVADTVKPTGKITRSGEVRIAENKYFYSGDVTLEFEIVEANFYAEDVDFKLDGASQSLQWSDNGDTHTAHLTVSEEQEHNYSLNYKDRSGNEIEQSDPAGAPLTNDKPLVIDRTKPVITVEDDVRYESANRGETISFRVSVMDKYIDSSEIKPFLTTARVVQRTNETEYPAPDQYTSHLEYVDIPLTNPSYANNTYTYTIDNIETDGYFHFTCSAKDYAGNENSTLQCKDSDGKEMNAENFDFTVNRNGSVFWVEWENAEKDGYTNSDEVSVILHEINVDPTTDGVKLKIVDSDDTREVTLNDTNYSGNSPADKDLKESLGWFESIYTLDNTYFEKDSHYTVIVTTRDKAGNVNISNDEEDISLVSFIVDRTPPIISSNVSSGQIIKSNGYEIEANIVEDNLDTESVAVTIDDKPAEFEREGKLVRFYFDNGTHNIRVSAKDLAQNEADEYVVTNLTVSDNPIVLWFANKPLFFGTTGGGLLVIAAVVFFIVIRGRKKVK